MEYLRLYEFRFSDEDHVWMVKLFYGLLLSDHIDHMYLNKFGQILGTLTGKEYLLQNKDLILDWRPLYDLYYKFEDSKQFIYGLLMSGSCHIRSVEIVVELGIFVFC